MAVDMEVFLTVFAIAIFIFVVFVWGFTILFDFDE